MAGFKKSTALEDQRTDATVMKAQQHIIDLFPSLQIYQTSALSVSKRKILLV